MLGFRGRNFDRLQSALQTAPPPDVRRWLCLAAGFPFNFGALRPGYSLSFLKRSREKRTRNSPLRLVRLNSTLSFIYLSRISGSHLQTAPPPDVRRWLCLAAEPLLKFWGCAPGYSLNIPNRSRDERTRNIPLRLHRLIQPSPLYICP